LRARPLHFGPALTHGVSTDGPLAVIKMLGREPCRLDISGSDGPKERWLEHIIASKKAHSMRALLKSTIISRLLDRIRYFFYIVKVLARLIFGGPKSTCNICGFHGRFRAYGYPPRYNAKCSRCGSLERHRLLALWVNSHRKLLAGRKMLHFAPEVVMQRIVKPIVGSYESADIAPLRADMVLNIEQIALPDQSVDVILCSHVLEHVNDRRALAELIRVLRSDGFALIMVPIVEGWSETYENASITTEADRIWHFGQKDHVRYYGGDLRRRIVEAGFDVEEFTAVEPNLQTYALVRGEKVFITRKKAAA